MRRPVYVSFLIIIIILTGKGIVGSDMMKEEELRIKKKESIKENVTM